MMRGGRWSPGWRMSLFVVTLLPVLLALALWQLERAAEKRAYLEAFMEKQGRLAQPPPASLADVAFERVLLVGSYDQDRYFLVDNQVRGGRAGYWVISIFRGDDGRRWLVNRGWIAAPESRAELPRVASPVGEVRLTGVFWPETGMQMLLAADPWTQSWPRRVQRLNVQRLATAVPDTQAYEVRLEAGQPGVSAAAPFTITVVAEKHTGYAVQWSGLALALLVGYVIFGFKRGQAA